MTDSTVDFFESDFRQAPLIGSRRILRPFLALLAGASLAALAWTLAQSPAPSPRFETGSEEAHRRATAPDVIASANPYGSLAGLRLRHEQPLDLPVPPAPKAAVTPAPVGADQIQAPMPPSRAREAVDIVPLPPSNPFRPRAVAKTETDRNVVPGPARKIVAVPALSGRTAATTPTQTEQPGFFQRVFGALSQPSSGTALAYARTEDGLGNGPSSSNRAVPRVGGGGGRGGVAVYDIEARTVYMPDGSRLEAHSGLGGLMDNTSFVREKNRGVTPPNVYDLTLREKMFHGVQAIRLNPVDPGAMYGRNGILAHSYLLGPNGQSNGCVSFGDYPAFLNAFLRGDVKRLVVVARGGASAGAVALQNTGRSGT